MKDLLQRSSALYLSIQESEAAQVLGTILVVAGFISLTFLV